VPHVKKASAGADSYGNEWPDDGAIIEVTDDQAADLVAIPDGGFTVVDAPTVSKPLKQPEASPDEDAAGEDLDEPAGEENESTDEAPADPPKRKPGRPRKTV
jgi:hypothetical protein